MTHHHIASYVLGFVFTVPMIWWMARFSIEERTLLPDLSDTVYSVFCGLTAGAMSLILFSIAHSLMRK